ncbi:MAG: glycyl-radical enzyme activating protein [Bacteroidetes bacterium]|nr:glycyl-radical enzyme activating protein [Bacteroidota bacterium]
MKYNSQNSGLIFDIKRFAINDGPGIRVSIFLKGCLLSCAWCHNPEGISPKVQKMYTASKCIGAKDCMEICPNEALTLTPNGIVTDTDACELCGKCASVCPTKAIEMSGYTESVENLVKIIEKERIFFDQSGGGVTISGGEPLLQSSFLIELLDACGRKGIHRTVDTTGFAKTDILLEVAKRTDLFLFDLKHMDSGKHKEWTGISNELILHNLKVLAETGANSIIRIPLIKGVNADAENIKQTAMFIASLPGDKKTVNLLPYHNIAIKKHEKLGQEYLSKNMQEPSEEEHKSALNIFAEYGVEAKIGG